MILLGLDTSTSCTSVAIADTSGVRAHLDHVGPRDHGAFLAPAIATCLARAGLDVTELDGVAVGVGPGLYTGLRVGMATAAALAEARAIPIVGLSGLDVLAHAVPGAARSAGVVATVDARRGQVFWARYGPDVDGARVRLEDPRVSSRAELDAAIEAQTQRTGVTPTVIGEVAVEQVSHPDARVLLDLARARFDAPGGPVAALEPLYLREADVRIGWAERGGVRGGAA